MATTSSKDTPKAAEQKYYEPIDDSKPLGTAENRFPSNIPVATPLPAANVSVRPAYSEYKGEYTRASDGEVYALAVVESDPLERTHKAINTAHYWEGTEAQFKKEFAEKK